MRIVHSAEGAQGVKSVKRQQEAGQCLSKGSKVTLTIESVTALRNLHAAPADEEAQPGAAAQGG